MKLRVFSPIYGPGFPERYATFALPSLTQAGNVPALVAAGHDVRVSLYTDLTSFPAVVEHGRPWASLIDIKIVPAGRGGVLVGAMHRAWQNDCLINEMRECIKADSYLAMLGAGLVYGNGTLANLAIMAEATGCAVSCIYLRAVEDSLRAALADVDMIDGRLSNDELATLAVEHLHPGSRSDFETETSRCHMWGLALKQLGPRLFAVRFQVPSVFVFKPAMDDVAYFTLKGDFREWDSGWLDYLISRRRFAFLASSDLAFIAEATRATKMNMEHHDAVARKLGPMVNRTEYQGSDRQRTVIGQIRTSRDVAF